MFYVYRKKRLFLKTENGVIFVPDWNSQCSSIKKQQ
jgi:hypothetical protein